MSIQDKIKPIGELQEEETYTIVIYGDPKVGKTRCASTMGEMYKTLHISLEKGTKSIDRAIPMLDAINTTSYPELQELYEWLSTGESGYEAVVIDNLSELQTIILRYTVDEFTRVHRPYGDTPGQSDYGRTNDLMSRLVKAFRDLPLHCIFVAWEKVLSDENVGARIVPALSGSTLPDAFIGWIDVCGRMYVTPEVDSEDRPTSKILFSKTPNILAGDRTGKLPRIIEEPTMPKIFSHLKQAPKEKK